MVTDNEIISIERIFERLTNLKADNEREHSVILEQVKKTNGSVADLSKWRYLITGALILMNIILVPVVVAVIIKAVMTYLF